jgi:predicted P-loop ATPase
MITTQENLFDIALERLDGVSNLSPNQGRRRVRALCPVHGDTEHSLVVTEFSESKLGIKCYTGCEYHEIMDTLGLGKGSIAPVPIKTHTKTKPHKGKEGNVSSYDKIARKQKPLGLYEFAEGKGLGPSTLEANDIVAFKDNGIDCVKIPYKLMNGEFDGTYRLRFGKKDNGKAGQKWSVGKKHLPYGLWKLKNFKKQGYLFLVEGETDSLTLWLYNLPAIGIPGADNAGCLKAEHLEGIHTIYVVDEKDQGGKTFVKGVTNQLQSIGWKGNLSRVTMPDGCKDPSDLHLKLDSYDKFLNQIKQIRKEAKLIRAEERIVAKKEIETGKNETTGTVISIGKKQKGNWKKQLDRNKDGNISSTAKNVLLVLNNDDNLQGKFAYNEFNRKPEIIGKVPWKRVRHDNDITDHDDSLLRNYLSIHYGIRSKDVIFDAVQQVTLDQSYHPIRKYFSSLVWDGIPRLDTLLIDFMGAEDIELNRMQTRLTFIGAVKRIFQPGCKFDYVLTLKGDQGLGKSSFFQTLAFNNDWFSDSIEDIGDGKEAKEAIQGKWIIELGEMAAVRKGDQKKIKQFVTSQCDEYRSAYGRRTNSYPRQCIFLASTNDDEPLKDDTGNRRWWIVEVKERWFEKDKPLEVNQIWAEALHQYKTMEENNIPLTLPKHLEEEAKAIQLENTDRGVLASQIEYILNEQGYYEKYSDNAFINVKINKTCAIHIWSEVLKRSEQDYNKAVAREINAILKHLDGWVSVGRKQFEKYGKQTVYVKDI